MQDRYSESDKPAWVASIVPRYTYHCVLSRMGVAVGVSLMVLSVYLVWPKVRSLGCDLYYGDDTLSVCLGECRRL